MDDMYNRITHFFQNARNFTVSGGNFSHVQGDQHNHTTIIKLPPFTDPDTVRRLLHGMTSDNYRDTYLEHEREVEQATAESHIDTQDARLISECESELQNQANDFLSYYVAFHDGVVKKAAFVDLESARAFYNLVSTSYAKLLIGHRTSMNQISLLALHGTYPYAKECKVVGESFGGTIPLCEAPFAAAFHRGETVHMAFFIDLASANAFYNSISYLYAKVLIKRSLSGVSTLATASDYRGPDYASVCRDAILANEDMRPLQRTPFVVSFHMHSEIMAALFQDRESAQHFYDAISEDYAKVLLDRSQTENVDLEMHVDYNYSLIIQCREGLKEARFPGTLEDSMFMIAYHEKGAIRLAGCVDAQSALAFSECIPNKHVKLIKRQTPLAFTRYPTIAAPDTVIQNLKGVMLMLRDYSAARRQLLAIRMDDMYNRITHFFQNARNFTVSGGNFSHVQGDQHNHNTIIKLPPFTDPDTFRRLLHGMTSDNYRDTYLEHEHEVKQATAEPHIDTQDARLISECESELQNQANDSLSYYVAFHDGVVKKAAFIDLASAKVFYDLVSTSYAKLLIAHRTSANQILMLAFHGTPPYTKKCKEMGERFGGIISLREAPFAAAFHRGDTVYTAFFVDLASADAFYKNISYSYAKVLIERSLSGVSTLASHCHGVDYVSVCRNAILANEDTRPLRTAPFVVSFHEHSEIKAALFKDQESAQSFYDSVSEEYAKVLLDRSQTENVDLEIHVGYDDSPIIQCREGLKEAGFPGTLKDSTFTIAFHEKGAVRLAGCVEAQSTLAFSECIPNEHVKLIKRQTPL
ncbi:hypothetical protein PQX77_012554 [Marasmius sp. AFHP31]|nr:hypothetical protein PQX77_012554 [Marasmius sp. AFHP31]